MSFVFFLGFLFGAMAIIFVEALGFLLLLRRLQRKEAETIEASARASEPRTTCLDTQESLEFAFNKQGVIWVLESDKIPKEQKKKEILEVNPVRKNGKIKGQLLILNDLDGSEIVISLKGCIVSTVSATNASLRKWAKKYPIKVQNRTSVIYNGSKALYLYLETSWEKESWCKALRIATCVDSEKIGWFVKLNEEFHSYLLSLNAGYPSFLKPLVGFNTEAVERTSKGSSKVRQFWKKLGKKASKAGPENRSSLNSLSGREERKISEKPRSLQDLVPPAILVKTNSTENKFVEDMVLRSPSTIPRVPSQPCISALSDTEADDKLVIDEGTLCWNLLISRLFFDAKSNAEMINSFQARIQRTLSNMRIPTYVGDVICTGIHIGNIPPYIHSMRVLPMDMNEVWGFEIDIEYNGGASLDIETRLEVRELGMMDTISETSSIGEATSDILEEFEYMGKKYSESSAVMPDLEGKDASLPDESRGSKSIGTAGVHVSRWRSLLNSVAKQVSQVPISLTIKVASLRGTMRLNIKPPPSDQLWFGFTSMPDINLNLESSVGERSINSGRVAVMLVNRFKAAIRDTVVLPNCEYACIPWMLGEKDDWLPRGMAPFIWVNQEGVSSATTSEVSGEAKTKVLVSRGNSLNQPELKLEKAKTISGDQVGVVLDGVKNIRGVQPAVNSSNALASSLSSISSGNWDSRSLQDLRTPLLDPPEHQEARQLSTENRECQQSFNSDTFTEESSTCDEDDLKAKRMGRRARMLDLGKKMGEKLEEKRRHIEEKSRHIMEKMRREEASHKGKE